MFDFSSHELETHRRALRASPSHDLSPFEIATFSPSAALLEMIRDVEPVTLEADFTRSLLRHYGADPHEAMRKCVVPAPVLKRALSAATGPKGGYLLTASTESELRVVDMLRPLSALVRAGATSIPGLKTNLAVPRQTGGVTATWLTDAPTSVTPADQTLGQLSVMSHGIAAITTVSYQELVQAPRLADRFIMTDLAAGIATALDTAGLQGTGASGQPLGVLNVPGMATVSGTTLGVAGLLQMQKTVINAGGLSAPDAFAYVTTGTVAETLAQRPSFASGTAAAVWQGALAEGTVLGARAIGTPNMAANSLVAGDFSRLLFAQFYDGLELSIANANFAAGTINVRALLYCDVVCLQPGSFVLATSIS